MRRRFLAVLHPLVSSRIRKSMWYVMSKQSKWKYAYLSQGNAGDSRSVLGVKGRAKPLSFDHKPQNEGSFS